MARTAPKPKPPKFITNRNIKYKFLCATTAANLDTVRRRYGLTIETKSKNGNIAFKCSSQYRRNCKYRALFLAKRKAIYVHQGRKHSHPVNVPQANEDEDGQANAPQQDHPDEEHNATAHEEENGGINENQAEEAMEGQLGEGVEEPTVEGQEADEIEEKPVVNNMNNKGRLVAANVDVQDAQQLVQLCGEHGVNETGRLFRCEHHPNCPFYLSLVTEKGKLFAYNEHNHG